MNKNGDTDFYTVDTLIILLSPLICPHWLKAHINPIRFIMSCSVYYLTCLDLIQQSDMIRHSTNMTTHLVYMYTVLVHGHTQHLQVRDDALSSTIPQSTTEREYLEGSEVEQGKAVEKAQALKCHLDHSRVVRLLKRRHVARLGLRHGAVQQDTIQHVQNADKISVL